MGTAQFVFGRALQIVGLILVGKVVYDAVIHDLPMDAEIMSTILGLAIFWTGHFVLNLGGD